MGPAIFVPLALAAISSGAQYANNSAAQSREQQAETTALANQQQIKRQGQADVARTVQDISKSNPGQIASNETGNLVAQLRRNAAGATTGGSTSNDANTFGQSVSSLAPVAGGSKRFQSGSAGGQQQVEQYGNSQATAEGDLDAAVRQRQNEGIEMGNTETKLQGLNAQSYGQNFVDQLRAQTSGQPNPWVGLFSTLVGSAAGTLAKTNGANANPNPAGIVGYNPNTSPEMVYQG